MCSYIFLTVRLVPAFLVGCSICGRLRLYMLLVVAFSWTISWWVLMGAAALSSASASTASSFFIALFVQIDFMNCELESGFSSTRLRFMFYLVLSRICRTRKVQLQDMLRKRTRWMKRGSIILMVTESELWLICVSNSLAQTKTNSTRMREDRLMMRRKLLLKRMSREWFSTSPALIRPWCLVFITFLRVTKCCVKTSLAFYSSYALRDISATSVCTGGSSFSQTLQSQIFSKSTSVSLSSPRKQETNPYLQGWTMATRMISTKQMKMMHIVQKSLVLAQMHSITSALIRQVYIICRLGYLKVPKREDTGLNSLMYSPRRLNYPSFRQGVFTSAMKQATMAMPTPTASVQLQKLEELLVYNSSKNRLMVKRGSQARTSAMLSSPMKWQATLCIQYPPGCTSFDLSLDLAQQLTMKWMSSRTKPRARKMARTMATTLKLEERLRQMQMPFMASTEVNSQRQFSMNWKLRTPVRQRRGSMAAKAGFIESRKATEKQLIWMMVSISKVSSVPFRNTSDVPIVNTARARTTQVITVFAVYIPQKALEYRLEFWLLLASTEKMRLLVGGKNSTLEGGVKAGQPIEYGDRATLIHCFSRLQLKQVMVSEKRLLVESQEVEQLCTKS